ncbi:MAG: InlB B-repeat-containing protein [Lachnospiraceae bacterium]|nr:InlB B-repeat-containing protein [Lachnospiraceae bacterium]
MPIFSDNKKAKLRIGGRKIKKAFFTNKKVYSSGNICTYHVDSGQVCSEEVDEGVSCLFPKTFIPTKSGWTFVGWREDTSPNGTVLTEKNMSDNPIALYAVFRQTITVTYYNGSSAASNTTGSRYYNNGTIANPSFTLGQAPLSGWTARGWASSASANAGIVYNNGVVFSRDSNCTLYGCYYQTITLSYSGNGSTGGSTAAQTGTRYWNTGNVINPSFSLQTNGFTRTNYAFQKWAAGSTGGTQYAAGSTITLSASTTMYALWIASTIDVLHDSTYMTYTGSWSGLSAGDTPNVGVTAVVNSPYVGNKPNQESTGSLTINLGPYKKATIIVKPGTANTTAWYDNERHGKVYINGSEVYNSNNQNNNESDRTYSTTVNTTMSFRCCAKITGNNGGAYTYVVASVKIKSITLSM